MTCVRGLLGGLLLAALWARAEVRAQTPAGALRMPPVPGKALPIDPGPNRVARSFAAAGVETVVLRAGAADRAEVATVPGSRAVTASGMPTGGAVGYHPADPNWRETPASRWGLDFRAKAFGPTLVISTSSEIRYIHHDYHLDGLRIAVPPGVKVVKENRELTGESAPDLSAPAVR